METVTQYLFPAVGARIVHPSAGWTGQEQKMTSLTKLEIAVLAAIDSSEYGDELQDAIWTWSIWDHVSKKICPNRKSLSGAVSSLVKKGIVSVAGTGNDSEIRITEKGVVFLLTHGVKTRKWDRNADQRQFDTEVARGLKA